MNLLTPEIIENLKEFSQVAFYTIGAVLTWIAGLKLKDYLEYVVIKPKDKVELTNKEREERTKDSQWLVNEIEESLIKPLKAELTDTKNQLTETKKELRETQTLVKHAEEERRILEFKITELQNFVGKTKGGKRFIENLETLTAAQRKKTVNITIN